MNKQIDCVVAGHTCIDLIPEFGTGVKTIEEFFKPGKLIGIGMMSQTMGGVVPNVAAALSRLGIETYPMGKIGDDFLGQIV